MALKTYKPVTPGQRQLVLVDRAGLHKGPPVKALTRGQKRPAGRNNLGRIVVRWQGGGHKQSYRIIDFKRAKHDQPATVQRLEYDPNRTSFIALIKYKDGELAYIIAPQRLAEGDVVVSGDRVDVKPGNAMPLAAVPVGTIVHNIEMKPGKGGQIARAAGTYAQYLGRDSGYALLRLNSGEVRRVRLECKATIGAVSNPDHMNEVLGKGRPQCLAQPQAFRSRHGDEPDRSSAWRRRRPHQGRPSSGDAVGQADQGRQDPQEQADRQEHRALAALEKGARVGP